ncbi:MAG: 5-oxoprolinase subunit PxpA [Clostridia bacterium]|nr:5-oxoprolinase subunit PxpA [Clostridia bacterium]
MRYIDINCDMGENRGDDAAIIKYISSANIACGGHAGDVRTMIRTIRLAKANGVAIGAHPGYPDRGGFGRSESGYRGQKLIDEIVRQISVFEAAAVSEGSGINHIKLHGALYNKAASDYGLMKNLSKEIINRFGITTFYTLAGSVSEKAVGDAGGTAVSEGFADRAYSQDGRLVPRGVPGAVIHNADVAAERALGMVRSGTVETLEGLRISLKVETICVHGDTPGAVAMAAKVNEMLRINGIGIGNRDAF